MKPSQRKFKFPIRVLNPIEAESDAKLNRILNREIGNVLDYVITNVHVPISQVIEWRESFTYSRTIEDVKRNGCDTTVVHLMLTGECTCDWPVAKFMKEYDKHYAKLKREKRKITENDFMKADIEYRKKELEDANIERKKG